MLLTGRSSEFGLILLTSQVARGAVGFRFTLSANGNLQPATLRPNEVQLGSDKFQRIAKPRSLIPASPHPWNRSQDRELQHLLYLLHAAKGGIEKIDKE